MRKRRGLLPLTVIAVLLFLLATLLRTRVDPLIAELAVAMVEDAASNLINDAVDRQLADMQYRDLVDLQYSGGTLVALTTDVQAMNRLKTGLLKALDTEIYTINEQQMGIPVGNVSGISLLSGRGAAIPVRVVSVASSDASFFGEFYAAGINQTIHRIVLNVSLDLVILLPDGTVTDRVSTDICVAETVLLGAVPDSYFGGEMDGMLYPRGE